MLVRLCQTRKTENEKCLEWFDRWSVADCLWTETLANSVVGEWLCGRPSLQKHRFLRQIKYLTQHYERERLHARLIQGFTSQNRFDLLQSACMRFKNSVRHVLQCYQCNVL